MMNEVIETIGANNRDAAAIVVSTSMTSSPAMRDMIRYESTIARGTAIASQYNNANGKSRTAEGSLFDNSEKLAVLFSCNW